MEDRSINALFDALIQDKTEKKIMQLISQDLDHEQILEQLLNLKTKRDKHD